MLQHCLLTASELDTHQFAECREQYAIPVLVKMLEPLPYDALTAAATDALKAIAVSNEANKAAVREAWAFPLLARLMQPRVSTQPGRVVQ